MIRLLVLLLLLSISNTFFAQESKLYNSKLFNGISKRVNKLSDAITSKTETYLNKLLKEEEKLYKKLKKKDSVAAELLFEDQHTKYAALKDKLFDTSSKKQLKEYLPALDTLKGSLGFLSKNISPDNNHINELKESTEAVNLLENKMQVANEIKKQLRERKKLLNEQLEKHGLTKELKKFNKETYYYQQQIQEYKALLNDPKNIEKKTIAKLRESSAFKEFMKKNSMLAKLFRIPDNYGSPESLAGLQTRANVQQILNQRIAGAGTNPQQYVQQQMKQATAEIDKLKNKMKGFGNSSDMDMPEGFKPNNQKTKGFFKRLEYGTNIQTQKMNSLFPITSDIALTVGYKLNDKSVVGIGASYKLGLGSGWKNLKITHEGIGLRSYVDVKLKGNFWITGGYEQNYNESFRDFAELRETGLWRQSALAGLIKKMKVGKKTSSVQLLYDFLHTQNNIRTQPLLFRVGYGF